MLSPALDAALEIAREAVNQHPQYALIPARRLAIYNELGPIDIELGHRRRGWLAIRAAEHVAPIWRQRRPQDDRVERLLDLGKDALVGTADVSVVRTEARACWDWLTNDYGTGEPDPPEDAGLVLLSAIAATQTTLGGDRFDHKETWASIDEATTDADLDPWSIDAAAAAAAAYASPVWDTHADPDKRRAFWAWWLTDAVPFVWTYTT